ncbi:MAG: hypothetical protein CML41_01895 [Rhodobacteraceae bacterium]|jgi:hypothetical protein|nr:hypothetical protein [Paracoccaceae bacterium]|tara:strand:+ start:468 stop:647 length:180 start_codon:yes stop_codon:yes gene_type:complete
MKLDESKIAEIANLEFGSNGDELAKIIIQMIDIEYSSRHQSRPKMVKLLSEILDSMEGE